MPFFFISDLMTCTWGPCTCEAPLLSADTHIFALNYFMISLWLVVMLAEGSGMTGSDVIHPHERQCCTELIKICLRQISPIVKL